MKNVSLLFLVSEFPPSPGGIGNHAFNLAKYLSLQGKSVIVATVGEGQSDEENSFTTIRCAPQGRLRKIFFFFKLLKKYRDKTEVVAASGLTMVLITGIFTLLFGKKSRYISMAHGLDINYHVRWVRKLIHFLLQRFDAIVAVSRYTASHLPSSLKNKTIVINNGFEVNDNYILQPSDIKLPGFPSLITVGRITDRKGQQNVIQALPAIKAKYPEVHYHMIGIPEKKDEYEQLATSLNVMDQITFHGILPEKKKIEYLKGSDIFVMLSQQTADGDFEGFGIAILEANVLGIPAIGSKGCGIEDAIQQGYSGFLVNPHSSEEMLTAITTILNNYTAMQQQATQFSKSFTWDKVIAKYEEVLTK